MTITLPKCSEMEVDDDFNDSKIVFSWRLRMVMKLSRENVFTSFIPLYSPPQSTHTSSIECEGEDKPVSKF